MQAESAVVEIGFNPIESVLGYLLYFMNASVIDIYQLFIFDQPFKSLSVVRALAGLKNHEQMILRLDKLGEDRIPVVFIKVAEIGNEVLVFNQRKRLRVEMITREFIDTENIAELNVFTQPKMDVVTEDGEITKGHDTSRHAAVDGRDALIGDQLKSCGIENLLAGDIQL